MYFNQPLGALGTWKLVEILLGLFLDMLSSSKPFFFLYYLKRRKKMQKNGAIAKRSRACVCSRSVVRVSHGESVTYIFSWFTQLNACFAVLTFCNLSRDKKTSSEHFGISTSFRVSVTPDSWSKCTAAEAYNFSTTSLKLFFSLMHNFKDQL